MFVAMLPEDSNMYIWFLYKSLFDIMLIHNQGMIRGWKEIWCARFQTCILYSWKSLWVGFQYPPIGCYYCDNITCGGGFYFPSCTGEW